MATIFKTLENLYKNCAFNLCPPIPAILQTGRSELTEALEVVSLVGVLEVEDVVTSGVRGDLLGQLGHTQRAGVVKVDLLLINI